MKFSQISPAVERGTYGYLAARQKRQFLMTALWAVIVVLFGSAGYAVWHTRYNYLMVPAMVCVIPTANYLVAWLALAKFSSGSREKYEALASFEENGMLLCDMVVVDEKGKRLPLEFAVVYKNGIAGFQADAKDTHEEIEITVNSILTRRKIPMRLKVYRDWDAFSARISEMEIPADEDSKKHVKWGRDALLSVCL